MPDHPDLTALIASRICHDLISPIGAISNGVELLGIETPDRPELQLLSESAANANARIRFFRISFGAAGPDQRIGKAEVMSVLTDLSRAERIRFDWTSAPDLSRREVRLVFLLLQCLETALAYGGKVQIAEDQGRWQINASAPRLKIDSDLWAVLSDSPPPQAITAAQVQFALVPTAQKGLGRKLMVEIGTTSINLTL